MKTLTYRGVPKDVSVDGAPLVNYGDLGAPFWAQIDAIAQQVQEIRLAISHELNKWLRVKTEARENEDDITFDRASAELDGLYEVLNKLGNVGT
jgi:hypothetical protein